MVGSKSDSWIKVFFFPNLIWLYPGFLYGQFRFFFVAGWIRVNSTQVGNHGSKVKTYLGIISHASFPWKNLTRFHILKKISDLILKFELTEPLIILHCLTLWLIGRGRGNAPSPQRNFFALTQKIFRRPLTETFWLSQPFYAFFLTLF